MLEAAVAKGVVLRGFLFAPNPPPIPPALGFYRLKPKAPLGSVVAGVAEVLALLVCIVFLLLGCAI